MSDGVDPHTLIGKPEEFIAWARSEHLGPDRVAARKRAEAEARELLDRGAGRMTEEDAFLLGRTFNTDFKGKEKFNRFAPAFHGASIKALVKDLEAFNHWTAQLWSQSEEEALTAVDRVLKDPDALPGAGSSYPTMLMYLRDPSRYSVWIKATSEGLRVISGYVSRSRSEGVDAYLDFCKEVSRFAEAYHVESQELDVVFTLAWRARGYSSGRSPEGTPLMALGNAFKFLGDLRANNENSWMDANRERYKNELDVPFRRLLQGVADKYVVSLDPELITEVKTGKVLANIRKRFPDETGEYYDYYWGAFSRSRKQEDIQLFVNIHWDGMKYGLFLGSASDHQRALVEEGIRSSKGKVWDLLQPHLSELIFEPNGHGSEPIEVKSEEDIFSWIKGESPELSVRVLPDDPVLNSPADLVIHIGETFTLLHPLARLGWEDAVTTEVPSQPEDGGEIEQYTLEQLAQETYLPINELEEWISLLTGSRKRQAILYGPPGTGKTFVARLLGKCLAQSQGEVQIVQFHPAFSYEDFLEGLRPATSADGITYEVRPGLFHEFCDLARGRPGTFVFVIDEINRAELGAVLGELMMLLEYREETIQLPYSQRRFSIPLNVVVLATMNTADRSLALVDFALRRRFHAIQMLPRREVLQEFLKDAGQEESPALAMFDLVQEYVNNNDFAPGHSYWMEEDLTPQGLDRLWRYELKPYLSEYWFEHQQRLQELDESVARVLSEAT